jgi:hypothetical protein
MRSRILPAFGVAVASGAVFFGCNALLGIDKATVGPSDSGADVSPETASPATGDGGTDGPDGFVAQDDCNDYCNDIAQACAPPNREYLSADVCHQLCQFHIGYYDEQGLGMPVDVSATSAAAMGDTLYCRVWHSHAALENPSEHCPHAGPLGAEVCGTNPCDDFCQAAFHFCGTMSYASAQDCLNACNPDAGYPGFPYLIGSGPDLQGGGGNTLNCRIYHLENFLFTGLSVHCSHITASGGGVCVDVPDASVPDASLPDASGTD